MALFCALAVLVPTASHAQELRDRPTPAPSHDDVIVAPTGLQLGARLAYGLGSGDVYRGLGVADGSNGFVPVVVDIGARVIPQLYVGAYGGYAYVLPKHNAVSCPDGYSCNIGDWRFGLQVDWHFMPNVSFDPYVGLSGGYEILHNSVTGPTPVPTPAGTLQGSAKANVTDRGWEFLGLTLGADFRVAHLLAIGPFFTASIGEFGSHTGSTTVSVGGSAVATKDAADVEHRPHEIYMLGLRGTLNPL
jgi:hypothetical protein